MQTPTQNNTANTTDRHPLQYVLATAVILSGAAFALRAFADSALPTLQRGQVAPAATTAQAPEPKTPVTPTATAVTSQANNPTR